jgi:thiamine-monophosphate kinase
VYVSGTLGDAALALAVESGRTRVDDAAREALRQRLHAPQPRVALGVALRGIASSALDISDGLTGDLGHIVAASEVGASIDLGAIPCSEALRAKLAGDERKLALACLLAGGDDYELCFTAPRSARAAVEAIARAAGVPCTPIGTIEAARGLIVHDERGRPLDPLPRAFDHFR